MFDDSTRNGSVPIPEIMHGLYPQDKSTALAKLDASYANSLEEHEKQFKDGLPEIGTFYRHSVTGVVYEVLSLVQDHRDQNLGYKPLFLPLLIVLRAADSVSTIAVAFNDFYSCIEPEEAFDFKGVGPYSERKRFEQVDPPAPAKPIEYLQALTLEQAQERLNSKKKRLYVVNTMMTQHGLPDILFDYAQLHKDGKPTGVCKLPATWVPVDVLTLVPRESLVNNARFLSLLREGHIKIIRKRDFKKIMATQEAVTELNRVRHTYEHLREIHRPRPIKAQVTNPDEAQ
jgi:hypothetical protein